MRVGSAGHMHPGRKQHIGLEMNKTEVASRPDVDMIVESRARFGEERPESDDGRRCAVEERAREEGAAQILSDEAGNERERLTRSFERTVAADETASHEIRDQGRNDG